MPMLGYDSGYFACIINGRVFVATNYPRRTTMQRYLHSHVACQQGRFPFDQVFWYRTNEKKTNGRVFAFFTFFACFGLLDDSEVETNDVLGGDDGINFKSSPRLL